MQESIKHIYKDVYYEKESHMFLYVKFRACNKSGRYAIKKIREIRENPREKKFPSGIRN